MLELLPRLLLVLISHKVTIDLGHVRETVHDERAQKNRVRNFVALDGQRREALQRLQLGDLNEAVDVVVLEEESLQVDEALQLRNVRGTDDRVETHVLEADLHDSLLEVDVGEHFQGVTVDEQ